MARITCEKCKKTMDSNQFYSYRNGEKAEICKKCLTMHVDNFNPETYVWILEKMDVPYVPSAWNTIRDNAFAKNPNLNGMSVVGKYLSKMKLKQWKEYGWADSQALQEKEEQQNEAKQKEIAEMERITQERFERGEISEAEYKTLVSTQVQNAENIRKAIEAAATSAQPQYMDEDELTGPAAELTEDDKLYLAMKWGRLYKPNEWIELERIYEEMMASFDIQDADTAHTLLLICKTNLKMNQAIDIGDLDGFQKLSRVSESLRKSAKFTAAQNKEEKNDFVDCVGELVSMCERDGFIPRFATDIPQDKVDLTLKDMNNYLYKLVTQDLGFGQQIEDSLKKLMIKAEMNKDIDNDYESGETEEILDENIADFYDEIAKQKEKDKQLYEEGGN